MKKFIVLEYGGFEELKNKVNRGDAVEEKEKKTITNYLHQQKQIGDGFDCQGWAMYRVGEYNQSC